MWNNQQAVRRVQYELPGFAAGEALAALDRARRMLTLGRQAEALAEMERAARAARDWQRLAVLVVDYDAARDELRREKAA